MKTLKPLIKNCGGKVCYGKKEVMSMKNFRERDGSKKLDYYKCSYCNYWHLRHLRGKNVK